MRTGTEDDVEKTDVRRCPPTIETVKELALSDLMHRYRHATDIWKLDRKAVLDAMETAWTEFWREGVTTSRPGTDD